MGTNGKSLSENSDGIPEVRRQAMLDALVRYFLGQGGLVRLLDATDGITATTYYRLRDNFPDDFLLVETEARSLAAKERSSTRVAFESRQENESQDLQEYSLLEYKEIIDQLRSIAKGETYEVETLVNRRVDGDWKQVPEKKTVIPFPRDQVSAAGMLRDIARDGMIPERAYQLAYSPGEEVDDDPGGLMPMFSASSAFKRIEAVAPDGTKVTATVDHPEVIEVLDEDDSV
jgi:hypothetical protein